jgi:hypothetical protein
MSRIRHGSQRRKKRKALRTIHMENYRKELEARERFLLRYPSLTRGQLRNAINPPHCNPNELIERWIRSGKILCIKHHKKEFFPGFQFSAGKPIRLFKQLITLMRNDRSDWSIAHWLVGSNGWLDGDCPLEILLTEGELVLDAAEQEILHMMD